MKTLMIPNIFGKQLNILQVMCHPPTIPEVIIASQGEVRGKQNIVDTFNKHFINAGIATQSTLPANPTDSVTSITDLSNVSLNNLNFTPISVSEVRKALLGLDCKKSAGPDQIEPYFLKTAANLIADPISSIFNLS